MGRFEGRLQNPGVEACPVGSLDGWADLSKARAEIVKLYQMTYPGSVTLTWRDNSELVYKVVVIEGKTLYPVYDLYCDGFYTGYSVLDNQPYGESAMQAAAMLREHDTAEKDSRHYPFKPEEL